MLVENELVLLWTKNYMLFYLLHILGYDSKIYPFAICKWDLKFIMKYDIVLCSIELDCCIISYLIFFISIPNYY